MTDDENLAFVAECHVYKRCSDVSDL